MICTTNCTWALTKIMVNRIVRRFGEPFPDGQFSFPTPASLAAATEQELRKHCTTGYRAPFNRRVGMLMFQFVVRKFQIQAPKLMPLSMAKAPHG